MRAAGVSPDPSIPIALQERPSIIYLTVPVVTVNVRPTMSLFRRRKPIDLRSIDARRICLIKPSAFGDVVQTLPLLPVLKERFPNAQISWVINSGLRELLEDHPQIDDLISYRRHGTWKDSMRLLRELRQRQFDLVFDLQGLLRTGIMTFATRAKIRVGLESAREGSSAACHITLSDTDRFMPAHLRYWRVAEALGLGNRNQIGRAHV